ncbi:NGG1p interacting factor NIF3 [Heliorestis acidaminivorans]|uniref:NGG1p interacting factor NIF3 n=1 Tax=Heliorestis acidaminivorans TaxID=553427 RepID=A0A6I0ES41_9FIRM|nr:NGG1p interacting factor NIF3 [Heliorestis acidaminivorans]KAB2951575.1 NGG1p interacting factor NIF3 [Heliorestis acidaminivorans]
MKLQEIYQLMVSMGVDADPRGRQQVESQLAERQKEYEKLKEAEREDYNIDSLQNPYSDTAILYGDGNRQVKRLLVGIDVEVGEVLLADRLREKGNPIDLVVAHHPEGKALSALHQVMHMQEDLLHRLGVPVNVAEGIMASRIGEVKRGLAPLNHNRAVDAAAILDLPIMCVHTPADNQVQTFLQRMIDERNPQKVSDILKLLKEIPEYKSAAKRGSGPTLFAGRKDGRCGKVVVDMTGGTSGSEEAYAKLAQAGVGTIVGMHMGEKHRKEAEKYHINVVIAGHMASDSLGMNLLLDALERQGLEIVPCAGMIRFSRNIKG